MCVFGLRMLCQHKKGFLHAFPLSLSADRPFVWHTHTRKHLAHFSKDFIYSYTQRGQTLARWPGPFALFPLSHWLLCLFMYGLLFRLYPHFAVHTLTIDIISAASLSLLPSGQDQQKMPYKNVYSLGASLQRTTHTLFVL